MRLRPTASGPLSLDMTSMIDVIFLLLIFWMTVARLAGEGAGDDRNIDTPVADAEHAIDIPRDVLTIEWAEASEPLLIAGRPVAVDALMTALGSGPQPEHVVLRAARTLEATAVQSLLADLQRLGIERVGLAFRGSAE